MRAALLLALLLALPAAAQVRTPGRSTVSEDSGPLRERGQPLREVSRPVRDGSGTIGETSRSMRSGPVRDGSTRSMRSGPVSSLSSGPMTQPRRPRPGGSVTAASAGAVTHDRDKALGERISRPLRELAPLQQQLRQLREHGDAAAVAAAAAPLAEQPDGRLPDDAGAADEARFLADDTGIAPVEAEVAADDGMVLPEGAAVEPNAQVNRRADGAAADATVVE